MFKLRLASVVMTYITGVSPEPAVPVLWVGACRVIDPPAGFYMASEALRLDGIQRDWRDLDAIAPGLARSEMASEDARFCDHVRR